VGGIQLQIIPIFDVGNMFAGTTKDVCKEPNGDCISYNRSLIFQARSFHVLNTPTDAGMYDGDTIHIKDFKSQLERRPKVISNLRAEAPSTLSPREILEVQIEYRNIHECIFNVYLLGSSEPFISVGVRKGIFSIAFIWLTKAVV
jgi:hypothetical protein